MKLMVPKGGTTGSRFLRTADLRFLVKSLRTSKSCNEPYFLDLIFPDLASHFESVKGQSLLPRMPMGAVRTAPYASLGGHDAWCILRNVNGYEVERGVSDEGDTIAVDVKGFSQLYQHSIGGDFYRIQDPTALELTSALQATAAELSIMSGVNATAQRPSEVREALEADLRFLAAHSLVDYSLLIIRHPHPKLLERWRGGSIATAMIAGAGVQDDVPLRLNDGRFDLWSDGRRRPGLCHWWRHDEQCDRLFKASGLHKVWRFDARNRWYAFVLTWSH